MVVEFGRGVERFDRRDQPSRSLLEHNQRIPVAEQDRFVHPAGRRHEHLVGLAMTSEGSRDIQTRA